VNAHCHLDYTNMAGYFPPPKVFTDWLQGITEVKTGWTRTDYFNSWTAGADMLLSSGTTTVADIEAQPELLPEVWNTTPLRAFSFVEMIGVTARRKPREILRETIARIDSLRGGHSWLGLSPHAPYSTLPDLLRLTGTAARRRRWRLVTHVAESALEFAMFCEARGSMYDWLKRSTRDMSDCGMGTPVEHLERCGLLGPNLLAIHANYLGPRDVELLARNRVSVAHCPRSHWYFGHEPFPLATLVKAGVNVCLGTDSLASVCRSPRGNLELSMFEEMRTIAKTQPGLSPREIVEMATINSSRALGLGKRVGQIAPSAFADLCVIPASGSAADAYESILAHSGKVAATMVNGHWAVPPPGN
jgi:cytosine/adenosine deaminase-related metal-dependent hydrolase